MDDIISQECCEEGHDQNRLNAGLHAVITSYGKLANDDVL